MARPLFEIAREIAADWPAPNPRAMTYLRGMHYLLGIDDRVADLDAPTTIRMFLLYAKDWTGAKADAIKKELQEMRTTHQPHNADLLKSGQYATVTQQVDCCDLCHHSLGNPGKYVEGHTHWKQQTRMCMHCNLFLSAGLDSGDGALYFCIGGDSWVKLWGEPTMPATSTAPSEAPKSAPTDPKLGFHLKVFGRRVIRKCKKIIKQVFRRSA